MAVQPQQQIAFHLTGRKSGSSLRPMKSSYRPALFARFGDLTTLRYDFPLLLNREEPIERAMLSLSKLIDDAVEVLRDDPDRDRIARQGYELERELRRDLAIGGTDDFATLWNDAATRLSNENEKIQDSARRLWALFHASGELVDVDSNLPSRVMRHTWSVVQADKQTAFREQAERLLVNLHGILEAETAGSEIGRTPDRLKATVGESFASAFNFDAMSRILRDAKPGFRLSDERRERIRGLIDILEKQRFYPLHSDGAETHSFAFERCSEALSAYNERHTEAVELLKALAIAELEANGDYRESVHNVVFENFGANGLDANELTKLPDYLVYTNSSALDASETAHIIEALSAGLPFRVMVQTDDILEPSAVAEGHMVLASRSRQLREMAIGLTDVFVLQSSASHLFQSSDALMRGLSYNGPALFSIFSGANEHTGEFPPYLVAAAAMESRAFPALVYDPSAGADWATRLVVDQNPSADDDWPVHSFAYENETLQAQSEMLAFTLADFMAMDDRFFDHFALVNKSDWGEAMIAVPESLQSEMQELLAGTIVPNKVPCVTLVDKEGRLQRAIVDRRTLQETRRCREMWRSLQELVGIHNSHAERLLAAQIKAQVSAALSAASPIREPIRTIAPVAAAVSAEPVAQDPSKVLVAEFAVAQVEESHGDEPYIETARCTTCNECTQLNNKMFAYNENKQAYIANPDGGTFRQLVEAAEGCQVSIIHPGKPRNLKEPGLDELMKRAAQFN